MSSSLAASVVIPTQGGKDRLHYPLDALKNQAYSDFAVIVILDGDIDATEEILQKYIQNGFDNLKYHIFKTNQGRSKALNKGIEPAPGRIIIRCDEDLEPRIDFIERHVAAHGDLRIPSAAGLTADHCPDSPSAAAYGRDADAKSRESALQLPASERWKCWVTNCSAAREAYDLVGGYDERCRRYGREALALGFRLTGVTRERLVAGGAVDRVLPFVPRAAGRILVTLCVETAGLSRIRYPERAREIF